MTDKKQTLRVAVKLMSLVMAGFLVYVFLIGLVGESKQADSLFIDINEIAPGEIKIFIAGKRRLLVLHRTPEQIALLKHANVTSKDIYRSIQPKYFVAWAYDPLLGCAIEYRQNFFKAVCADNYYDLAGRVSGNAVSADDLRIPTYQFVDEYRIAINVEN